MRTQFVAAWSAFIYDVSIGFAKYSFRLRCRGALAAEFTVDLGAVPFGQTAAQTVLRSAGLSSSNSNIEKGASAGPRAIFRQLIFMQTGIKTLLMTIAAVTAMDAASAAGIKELDTVEGIKNVIPLSLFRSESFDQAYGLILTEGPLKDLAARAVLVLDPEGKIVYRQLVKNISDEPDYDRALESIK